MFRVEQHERTLGPEQPLRLLNSHFAKFDKRDKAVGQAHLANFRAVEQFPRSLRNSLQSDASSFGGVHLPL